MSDDLHDTARRAIEEGKIAAGRDQMDHAENTDKPDSEEPNDVKLLETIDGAGPRLGVRSTDVLAGDDVGGTGGAGEYHYRDYGRGGEMSDDNYPVMIAVKEYRHLRAKIERLQEIVAKLPKTADGVPVVPGQAIWYWLEKNNGDVASPAEARQATSPILACCKIYCFNPTSVMSDMDGWIGHRFCYSTREAAEAAKGEA